MSTIFRFAKRTYRRLNYWNWSPEFAILPGTATRVLVNDRLDVALAAQMDGVHLPAYGLPAIEVRPRVRVLGVSTHSIPEAIAAEQAQADFIIFGPIFDTPGKHAVGLEALRSVTAAVHIPVLAIGGITNSNSGQIMEAGASGIAGIRLFQAESKFPDSR